MGVEFTDPDEAVRAERAHRNALGSGPRFRDTDPRPFTEEVDRVSASIAGYYRPATAEEVVSARGLDALIPSGLPPKHAAVLGRLVPTCEVCGERLELVRNETVAAWVHSAEVASRS